MVSAIGDAVYANFDDEKATEETNLLDIVPSEEDSEVDKFVPT